MSQLSAADFVYSINIQADWSWYPTPPGYTIYSIFMATKIHAEKRGCLSDQPDDRPGEFFPKEWRANQEETNEWCVRFSGTQLELIERLDEIGFSVNRKFDEFLEGISSCSEEYQAYQQKKLLQEQLKDMAAAKNSKSKM